MPLYYPISAIMKTGEIPPIAKLILNYFLFFTFSGWLIFETLESAESAQTVANTFDKFATFTDSYFKEDVDSFDEPYTLIKL